MINSKINKHILRNTNLMYPNSVYYTFLISNLPINRMLKLANKYSIDPFVNNVHELT